MGYKVFITDHRSPLGAAVLQGLAGSSFVVVGVEGEPDGGLDLIAKQHPVVVADTRLFGATRYDNSSVGFTRALVDQCREHRVVLLHFSSHEVFGATQHGSALSEQDQPQPDTSTGVVALEVEREVLHWEKSIIVRLPWLLDSPAGILERLCSALMYSDKCVVSDVWRGSPVFIEDAVRLTLAMVHQVLCGAQNWGYFHLHASDSCSEAELADHVARVLQKAGYRVSPVSLGSLEQRFIHSNGWLRGQRCTNNFGFQCRSWRQGVKTKVLEWLDGEVRAGRLAPLVSA